MFADLFYVDTSSGTVNYGAGPVVTFSGGVGPSDLAAGQTITLSGTPVYQPITSSGTAGLEFNSTRSPEGDMSPGSYGANANYQPDPDGPQGLYDENKEYGRRDFQYGPNQAFLVRMRRSNNTNGLDQEHGIVPPGRRCRFCLAAEA